jgi:hypothetical protein
MLAHNGIAATLATASSSSRATAHDAELVPERLESVMHPVEGGRSEEEHPELCTYD